MWGLSTALIRFAGIAPNSAGISDQSGLKERFSHGQRRSWHALLVRYLNVRLLMVESLDEKKRFIRLMRAECDVERVV